MNRYRPAPDDPLDREYLRITAIWRLMKHGHIDTAKAKELAARPIRGCYKRTERWLHNTIEIWARVLAREAALIAHSLPSCIAANTDS